MGYYVLSLNIPNEYYECYRTYIDWHRFCRHISSKNRGELVYVQISFNPIVDDKFIERIIKHIDEICYGNIEVVSFSKFELDKFAF